MHKFFDFLKPDVLDSNEKTFRACAKMSWLTFAFLGLATIYFAARCFVTGEPGVLGVQGAGLALFSGLACTDSLAYALGWEAKRAAKKD